MPKVARKTRLKKKKAIDALKKALATIKSDFERKYTCPECDKDLSCGSSLKRHLSTKHNKEVVLKFGRTYKGGRSFSNHRYYVKHKKPKDEVIKTDHQLRRTMVNQRAYQRRVFKAEAESLKQAVITSTEEIMEKYEDAEDLRKQLEAFAADTKAFHTDNMYLQLENALGLPDTFEIRYSIAFYFLLAIANRLPDFINRDYNNEEVAFGLCWENEKHGVQDVFAYNEKLTNDLFETFDNYFLGKGKKVKELKHNYMVYIATFLNVVFTACANKYIFIKREAKNPCYLLRTLFKEPLVPAPPVPKKAAKKSVKSAKSAATNEETEIVGDESSWPSSNQFEDV